MAPLIWAIVLSFIAVCTTAGTVIFYRLYRKCKTDTGYRSDRALWGGWTIAGAVVTLILVIPIGICSFSSVDSIKSEGVSQQVALDTQYVQDQNVLSTYVTSFEEQLGVANLQSAKIQSIITQAVAGQGSINDLVNPSKSPLYAALAEAYPQVTLSQYQNLIAYIQQGRQAFQNAQSQLLNMLSQFDTWRNTGFLFHPWLVSLTGAPNGILHVTINGKTLTGSAAEAQMWQIVRNPTAVASINSGLASALPTK